MKGTATVLLLTALAATTLQAAEARRGPATATLSVTATVMARALATTEYQSPELVISAADIARGYVEAPRATRLHVRTNSADGYLLAFESAEPLFTEVVVSGAGEPVSIASGNGWMFEPFTATTVGMELSYRFTLAPGVQPGSYRWPLNVTTRTL